MNWFKKTFESEQVHYPWNEAISSREKKTTTTTIKFQEECVNFVT